MILTTYIHYQQHNTSIKLVAGRQTDPQTDRQTNIAAYRAAIAANNKVFKSYRLKQDLNNRNNNHTLITA